MEKQFPSHRWHGRLLGMEFIIARTKGLNLNEEGVTHMSLLLKILSIADEQEKSIINSLLTIYNNVKKFEDESNITAKKEEAEEVEKIGIQEAVWVFKNHKSFQKLLDYTDFQEEEQVIKEKKKKSDKKFRLIACSIITIIALGLVSYNFFFNDYLMYNDVKKHRTVRECNMYYHKYPDGWFYEDVMRIEMEISNSPITVYRKYLDKFPEGKYSTIVKSEYNDLWDQEIAKYEQRDKSNENQEIVKYMMGLLQYLKEHRSSTVLLTINQTIELKDYSEYDEATRKFMEFINDKPSMPIEKYMLPLKENFTQVDKNFLTGILSKGVQDSFNKMFAEDFVKVVTKDYEADRNSPVLIFNYIIKNKTIEETELPSIWVYSENNIPKSYILAIDVLFDVKFTIPNSSIAYQYSEIGNPGDEISNILSINDGYRQMTQMCFARFSNKMSESMGLEKTY